MEETPDAFEIARRTWVANDGLVREARRLTDECGLDPAIAENLEEALLADDREVQYEAMLAFFRALEVALT